MNWNASATLADNISALAIDRHRLADSIHVNETGGS